MPTIAVNGTELYYEEHGSGRETIVFAHSFPTNCRLFDAQVEAFKDRYRCIAFDFRGQGRSKVTRSGYDLATVTNDTRALLEALNAGPCHFVGVSMGGIIGMHLAVQFPELLQSLTVIASPARAESLRGMVTNFVFANMLRLLPPQTWVNLMMSLTFGQTFLSDPARTALRAAWQKCFTSINRAGAARALRGVTHRKSIVDSLNTISLPTLILVGDEDKVVELAEEQCISELVAGSHLVTIPAVGHSAPVEEPTFVIDALNTFLVHIQSGYKRV